MESDNEFDKCKTLLLIAEDRSGYSQGSRKLNLNDYKTIGEHFVENYNWAVCGKNNRKS